MSSSEGSSNDETYHGYNGDQFYGEVLKNRYMLIDKLGYGAFSSVWLCYDLNYNLLKACKIQNSGDYEPLVVIKRNRQKALVVLDAEAFIKMHKDE